MLVTGGMRLKAPQPGYSIARKIRFHEGWLYFLGGYIAFTKKTSII
jgi:hypothetical protein